MKLIDIIRKMHRAANKINCSYCLIGGHAASLYRAQERFTKDVDFAIAVDMSSSALEIAEKLIKAVGFAPMASFIPLTENEPKRKEICVVSSKPDQDSTRGLIDILLPELPWVEQAVKRSQYNLVDLGFAKIPVITPEDLIIAKCYALKNNPDRFQDLDDLKDIFINVKELEVDYIKEELKKFNLVIPKAVQKYFVNR